MDISDKKKSKHSWIRWTGTVLAFGLILYLLYERWDEVQDAVRQISLQNFLFALLALMFSRFMVIGRWFILLRSAQIEVSLSEVIRLTFAGLFASNFLPSTIGGDVVRLAGSIQRGLDGSVITASLVMDRIVGVSGMVFLLPIGLQKLFASNNIGFFKMFLLPVLLIGISEEGIGKRIIKKLMRVFQKIKGAFRLWIKKPNALIGAFIFTGLHMLGWFGAMYIVLQDIESPLSLWLIGGLWSLVYLVTLVPISINGLGLQEVSIAYVFTNLGGISAQAGLTLALMIRTLLMIASLPGAVYLPSILTREKQDNS